MAPPGEPIVMTGSTAVSVVLVPILIVGMAVLVAELETPMFVVDGAAALVTPIDTVGAAAAVDDADPPIVIVDAAVAAESLSPMLVVVAAASEPIVDVPVNVAVDIFG